MAKKLVKTDKNGTRYFEEVVECWKCNGSGVYSWGPNACYCGACYACSGRGSRLIKTKEYTPEHAAKLEAAREKRRLARVAGAQEAEAKRQAEIDARNKAQAEREAEWAREKAASNFVGVVGDKLDAVVKVSFEADYELPSFTGYGVRIVHVYGMKDEQGNTLIWKTGAHLVIEKVDEFNRIQSSFAHKGDRVRIKATIKEHSEYKGEKQTLLTRCKLVEIIEEA